MLWIRRCRITEVEIIGQSFSPVLIGEASRHEEVSPVTVGQPSSIRESGSTLYEKSDCGANSLCVLAVDVLLVEALK